MREGGPLLRAHACDICGAGSATAPSRPDPVRRDDEPLDDSWTGIGLIERGMARQGYDLSLTRYANEGWRATFYVTGREHSATGATGSAWEATPWRAVQGAAWEALNRAQVAA